MGTINVMPQHVVIAGGGFGGYYAAKTLERVTPKDVRITLINDVNYMLYAPLLPGAAAGTLEPRHVVIPLREHLKRTELRLGWVNGGDPARQQADASTCSTGTRYDFHYDQLIVALGSVSRTFPIPGLVEHAIGFKTIAEAIALRNRVVRHLETAEEIDDPDGGARTSASCSSVAATRGSRALPSCRTSRSPRSSATPAAARSGCDGCWSTRPTGSCTRSSVSWPTSRSGCWSGAGSRSWLQHDGRRGHRPVA